MSNTKNHFRRFGALALLFAKFVPGLNAAAAPMAGLTRMPLLTFLAADVAGITAWSGTFFTIGYAFRDQIELAAENAAQMGSWALFLLAIIFAGYIAWKYYQRRRFIRELRVDRIAPEELMKMIDSGDDLAVVDLRNSFEVELDGLKLPGAIWIDLEELDKHEEEIPRDKEIILYCS